jgi:pyridoxamine 5'-phosphate oxidase
MNNSPIAIFKQLYDQELKKTSVRIPSACCLSTIGDDGFPNSRFVSLKDIFNNDFIITGTLTSRKGIEIESSEKVSLTFWWAETEKQIRVQGNAFRISKQLADKYFSERNRDSQIVSVASMQGQELFNKEELTLKYNEIELTNYNKEIDRPENWGGFRIEPIRIEFLEFKPTRFHERTLYELINQEWKTKKVQP